MEGTQWKDRYACGRTQKGESKRVLSDDAYGVGRKPRSRVSSRMIRAVGGELLSSGTTVEEKSLTVDETHIVARLNDKTTE